MVVERIRKYGDLERIEVHQRVPSNVLLDTIQCTFFLFWALWIILALKAVYIYGGYRWTIPGVEDLIQFCTQYDSAKLIWDKLVEIVKNVVYV